MMNVDDLVTSGVETDAEAVAEMEAEAGKAG